MKSRNNFFSKYYESDIFNLNPGSVITKDKPKLRRNRSSLECTKENVFNIGKEKRINRNQSQKKEREPNLNHSVEKRKQNLEKIYGSDIFNTRKTNLKERRRNKNKIESATSKSTCFDAMMDNEEYAKDLKSYFKQHRGEKKIYNPVVIYLDTMTPLERYYEHYYANNKEGLLPGCYLNSDGDIDENKLNYIKRRMHLHRDERIMNDVGADQKRKEGEKPKKELRYPNNSLKNLFKDEKRRFVDIDEFPENNCRINKQIQFESHIFSNDNNNYNKSNEEIKEINDRIDKEKNKHYHLNVLGQPIIKVNRNINITKKYKEEENEKLRPADLNWNSPQAAVMFNTEHTNNIYKYYGPRGPNSFQLKLFQYSDSGNRDTLTGEPKKSYLNMIRPKREEIINDEPSKQVDKMINELQNLNCNQRLDLRMKTSVLDCKSEDEWESKEKAMNEFFKKGRNKSTKNIKITEKPNNIDKKLNDRDFGYHDFIITYSTRGNQFEKFDENEIKKIFGAKGINAYDIHKNPFSTGHLNTISLKVSGNDSNNEINKKVKSIQEELLKKNYKVNIAKGNSKKINKRNTHKVNNNGGLPNTISHDPTKFKVMPPEYKSRKGFTKQFSCINYGYKKVPK